MIGRRSAPSCRRRGRTGCYRRAAPASEPRSCARSRGAPSGFLCLRADVGLVDLNRLALTAKRRQARQQLHGGAEAMRHEPGGLILNVENAHELMAADALSCCCTEGRQPEAKGSASHGWTFEHGADRDGELALAGAAATEPSPAALDRRDPGHAAAARAHRAVRPKGFLKEAEGGGFVVEVRCGQVETSAWLLETKILGHAQRVCQLHNRPRKRADGRRRCPA